LKVLVLAGSDTSEPPERRRAGPEVPLADKAFLSLGGRLVVEHALDLVAALGLTRVWVLAPEPLLGRIPPRHRFTAIPQPPGARFLDNLRSGAAAMAPARDEPLLIVFGDHPLVGTHALRTFLAKCGDALESADFFHALALEAPYREFGAWFNRTCVHLREMSGRASAFSLIVPSRVHRLATLGELYDVRKLERVTSLVGLIWRLLRWMGASAPRAVLDALLVYAAKEFEKAGRGAGRRAGWARRMQARLTASVPIGRLEGYAARVLGAERGVRIVPVAHGGIAIDVDFAEELAALEANWEVLEGISRRQDAALAGHG
jgi:CTP:molybdopterin cytidylyltransferase MocA